MVRDLDLREVNVPNYTPRGIETRNRLYQDSPCLRKGKLRHAVASVSNLR